MSISKAYRYHKPTEAQIKHMDHLREMFSELNQAIIDSSVPCRERALALTNLEQAAMWANKAITHAKI